MYSDPNLDTPPPRSQFRRPWSPEPFVPIPSTSNAYGRLEDDYYGDEGRYYEESQSVGPLRRQQRREASDASVEALDLADYARTLRVRQAEDPYPPFASQIRQDHYPPSFPVLFMHDQASRDSPNTPSLISRGPTLSSLATHHTASSVPLREYTRPFSLPTTPLPSALSSTSRNHLDLPSSTRSPLVVEPDSRSTPSDEIDITRFPKWSRNWYSPNTPSQRYHKDVDSPAESDIHTPTPPHLNVSGPVKKSIFDPGYIHNSYNGSVHPHSPYNISSPSYSSVVHGSRDLLPWSNDLPEYGQAPIDPIQKGERIRMLEREFGAMAKGKAKEEGNFLVDEDGKPLVGTLDEKGRLVTTGPKRRVVFRTLQILLAAGASIPILYAAVAIKNPDKPPPPANKPPILVLYVLSIITLLLLLYMFFFRPCCCVRSKRRGASSQHPLASGGMMVLPVGNNGKEKNKSKGGKNGKGKYGPPGTQDVQVNLIVDPTAFIPPQASESDSDDDYDSLEELGSSAMRGSFEHQKQQARKKKKKNKNKRRRGMFEGLMMEEDWKVARAWLKKCMIADVAGVVLWGAAFVFIMTGKKCPSGGFNGWCNAYNVSSASACLICIAFGVSLFFDVQDLHSSKQNPRTRTS